MKILKIFSLILLSASLGYCDDIAEAYDNFSFQYFKFETIFDPVLADPRWVRSSATYANYLKSDADLENVWNIALGKKVPIVTANMGVNQAEIAIQAGIFSIFDLNSYSTNLLNTDFTVGVPVSYRKNNFSMYIRYAHTSSHLGDEYIVYDKTYDNRLDVMMEKVDTVLSYDITEELRIYGGGGYILMVKPTDFKKASFVSGFEYKPYITNNGNCAFIIATHALMMEEHGYSPTISARVGGIYKQRVLISIDYFNGHSVDGQFYNNKESWIGLGVHIF